MQITPSTIDWSTIRRHLAPGIHIPSHFNSNLTFEIDRIESDKIFVWPMKGVRSPEQRSRPVTRRDFEIVLQHWNDYHSSTGFNIPTWNNTYRLGIIAYVLDRREGSLDREGAA